MSQMSIRDVRSLRVVEENVQLEFLFEELRRGFLDGVEVRKVKFEENRLAASQFLQLLDSVLGLGLAPHSNIHLCVVFEECL